MIPGYMTIREASEKWGFSIRYVNVMCHNGKIPGARMFGKVWAIPEDTEKPTLDRRVKSGEYKDWRKKHMKKKNSPVTVSMILALIMILAFPKIDASAFVTAQTTAAENIQKVKTVRGTIPAEYINKYGNAYLSISCEDFLAAGYKYGDIVKVKFLGKKYRMPFVSNYSDVDTGKPALLAREGESNILLAINMGDFATTYGLAVKTKMEDGTVKWDYPSGIEEPIKVSIWLKQAGGYADQYEIHKLVYTDERSDYLGLTDEEFANFRKVSTTGMGDGVLYRTASPIDPDKNRNSYAAKAIEDAGVNVILNLTDTEQDVERYEGFSESYYAGTNYKAIGLTLDFQSEEFQRSLAEGFRFMAANPGIYAVHCKEGKDRAGFVVAILECLMGASYEEVVEDYMVTFYNYYGVKEGDPRYDVIVNSGISKVLKSAFTFSKKDKKKDPSARDLSACAVKYLKKIGLTKQEIKDLQKNLSADASQVR